MHELSITSAILKTVLRHARRQRAARVHRILLVVSELSDLQPVWMQHYFDRVSRGSIAERARLEIEHQAPQFACNDCSAGFAVSLRTVDRVVCPHCGSGSCTLTRRADYIVEEIEVS
ncbi:MAG: hydrogenase maturation nickel metallochaperone HypA [Spirochaetaceae bacterium]|nr:MAG: hydrogenase maturation nickel metallochaperone HypA [Spirochaetaceae bacterium]